jgi:alkylation response protein AidB-like acyl-CoA dehydrogenase
VAAVVINGSKPFITDGGCADWYVHLRLDSLSQDGFVAPP